jgi:hypothetical protein
LGEASNKIITAISGIFVFIAVSYIFSVWLQAMGTASNVTAVMAVIAGSFSSYVILAVSGTIKEFAVKGGLIEFTAKMERDIDNVRTDVSESKRELTERISSLNQTVENVQFLVQSNIMHMSSSQTTIITKESIDPDDRRLLADKDEIIKKLSEMNERTNLELLKSRRNNIERRS